MERCKLPVNKFQKKTKAVLFHARQSSLIVQPVIKFENCNIEIVDTVKTLGILFNKNMSWDPHVSSVMSRLNRCVGVLAKFRSYLPVSVKLLIYNTLFLSHLNYCFLVWGSTTLSNISKLHVLQKKALRHIASVDYNAHTAELFRQFKIVPVPKLYEYFLCMRYKKSVYNCEYAFLSISSLKTNTIVYPFRSKEYWHVPFCRTQHGRQMLRHSLAVLLNRLIYQNIHVEMCSIRNIREYFIP